MKMVFCTLALMLCVVMLTATAGPVYRWTDEHGNVHFSSQRPPGVTSEKVRVKTSKMDPQAQKQLEVLKTANDEARKARLERAAEKNKLAAEATAQRERCMRARAQLENLTTTTRVYKTDDAGRRVKVGEEVRQENIKKTREAVAKYCA